MTCDHCGEPGKAARSPHYGRPDEFLRVAVPEGIFSVHRGCVDAWSAGNTTRWFQ
jgi:hypothetical protein